MIRHTISTGISHITSHVRRIALTVMLVVQMLHVCGAIRNNSVVVPFIQDNPARLYEKAERFQTQHVTDSALIYYSWLTETHRDAADIRTRELVGRALSEMGQIYYIYYNDYMSAYRCLAEAESILSDSDDTGSYAVVLLNLGNLFNIYEYIFPATDGNNTARGREYYDRSIETGIASGDWNIVCSAYINSVMTDLPYKVNAPLNQRMRRLLNDSIPADLTDYRLADLLCAGTDAIMKRTPGRARQIFTQMRDSIGLTDPRDRYMADLCLSAVAVSEGDYQDAIRCISHILTVPSDRNDDDVYMEVYDLLSQFYARIGRQDLADEYRIRYFETKDRITTLLVELEPTRIGIELEQVRDYAHRIDAEKKQNTVVIISLVIVLILLSGVAILIYRKNRQLTLKNRIIFDQTRSLIAEPTPEPVRADVAPSDDGGPAEPDGESRPEKYRDSSMTDATRRELISRIATVMSDIDEICDKGFSLQRLTALVGSNTSYISRVINEHYKITFGTMLNKYRVQEACRRMENTAKYGNLTIDAISESV